MISFDDEFQDLNKLNMDSGNKKEIAHQQDAEDHVMMAWQMIIDYNKKIKVPNPR